MAAMDFAPLERIVGLVEAAPQRGVPLILYGLVKAMTLDERGCVFALSRLRDLDAATREQVYALMELYVAGGHRDPRWQAAVARLDAAVHGG